MIAIRRSLAIMLCAVLLLSMLPNAIFAEDNNTFEDDEALWSKYWKQYDLEHPEPAQDAPEKKAGVVTTLDAMRARAEALVNYQWTPSSDIATWNGSSYNGKAYFPKGTTVTGVPYTLFVYELVPISLCSLEEYRAVASINYSTTAYCYSVGGTRTGPVYGSCCADLVSEVFGGDFMNGTTPRYHSVYRVRTSPYGTAYFDQKMKDIRAGDALSDRNDDHIIWVGYVTDSTITIYEQTPPAARKRVLDKAAYSNEDGYFVYNGKIYSTITKSNAFVSDAVIDIDPDGGTTDLSPITVDFGDKFSLEPGFVSRDGYALQGWQLYRPADGKWFVAGIGWYTEEEIEANGYTKHIYVPKLSTKLDDSWYTEADAGPIRSFTFRAVWRRDYTIRIDPNGGEADVTPFCLRFGQACILDPCYVERESYALEGWTLCRPADGKWYVAGRGWFTEVELRENGYAKQVYRPDASPTLDDSWLGKAFSPRIDTFLFKAEWKACPTVSVRFDSNGGTAEADAAAVTVGQSYGALPVPVREHFLFDGWYTEPSGGNPVTEDTEVTLPEDHVLYAHWAPDCAAGHDFAYAVTRQPAPDAEGILTGVCTRCGDAAAIRMPPLNSGDYAAEAIEPATCIAAGTSRYTWVSDYGTFSFDVSIPKTAHPYADQVTEPTCTAQGFTARVCSVCGDSRIVSYAAATGHAWDDGTVILEPDEARDGIRRHTCALCGETRDEVFPSYDHAHRYQPEVAEPTCTAQGFTVYRCDCGDSFEADPTAALGHAWDAGTVTEAPTLTDAGVMTYACTRCGQTHTGEIPPLPHTHSYAETVVPAACTAQGYTAVQCACGDSYRTDYTPALGHDWDEGFVSQAPTETSAGRFTRTCSLCGETMDEVLAPLPHGHRYAETVIAPTCTLEGFTLCRCICGLSYLAEKTAALEHEYDAEITAPTCTEAGYTVYACLRCGERLKEEDAPALGHDFSEGFCTRCGEADPDYVPPFRFDDVQEEKAFYFKPVYWAYEATPQITKGVDAAHFGPDEGCTRGQVVTFLWRAAGCPRPKNTHTAFTDVADTAFCAKAVAWAVEKNITKGTSATTFSPNAACTRGQIVTFLWRFRGKPAPNDADTGFTDVDAGAFCAKAVAWAVENGITKGMSDAAFEPDATCTRGQIVTFLYRAMGEQ